MNWERAIPAGWGWWGPHPPGRARSEIPKHPVGVGTRNAERSDLNWPVNTIGRLKGKQEVIPVAHPDIVAINELFNDEPEERARVLAHLDGATQSALQGLLARPRDRSAFGNPSADETAEEAFRQGLALTRLRFYL